jgi:hypothetical protein
MHYRISPDKFDQVKKRLLRESISDFINKDTFFWLIAPIIGYFFLNDDLVYWVFFYIVMLIFRLLTKIILLNKTAKSHIKNLSVKVYEYHLYLHYGANVQKIELSHYYTKTDRHGNLVVMEPNRNFLDRVFGLKKLKIPPELDGFNEMEGMLSQKAKVQFT